MPIYEYQCGACQHRLEVIQKFSDDPLKECPACQSQSLNKLVSSTSFQLKGAGWYATEQGSKSTTKSQEPASSGDSGQSSSTDKTAV
jgi:putative FmdB family regulatory protein